MRFGDWNFFTGFRKHRRVPHHPDNLWRLKAAFLPLIAFSMTLFLVLSGCETLPEENQKIEEVFALNGNGVYVPPPAVDPGCRNDRYQQPAAEVSRKIDILFVTDTSGSLNEERGAVAQGIDALINALPTEVDYRIGVMLAHGSTSTHSGRLFRNTSTQPWVYDSQTMSLADIRAQLEYRLTHTATDNGTDGGEVGLYSFSRALDADRLTESRTRGFFREDAALAVVFVADENDICSVYPTGITPVLDTNYIEPVAFARDCGGITAQGVYDKVKALQNGRPLVIAGVIYNNVFTVPTGGENEYGYGYSDIISVASGVSIDLANGHYQEGLAHIGLLATQKLNLVTEYSITDPNVNTGTIAVRVDGELVPFNYVPETSKVHLLEPGGALSFVDISYCMKTGSPLVSDACEAGDFVPKTVIQVGLSTSPTGGIHTSITTALSSLGLTPTVYSDAEIASGKPITDGITVLILSRKVLGGPVSQEYIDGIHSYLSAGGSLIAEYDAAALLFDTFDANSAYSIHFTPPIALYSGYVAGGGVLLPLQNSTTYVTDPNHPLMQGMPSSFLLGARAAYAITNHDAQWLRTSAEFISSGFETQGTVPAGTYPAVLSGRCGSGRVAIFTLSYFSSAHLAPISTMFRNSLYWTTGN